jgi:hypothetical protein
LQAVEFFYESPPEVPRQAAADDRPAAVTVLDEPDEQEEAEEFSVRRQAAAPGHTYQQHIRFEDEDDELQRALAASMAAPGGCKTACWGIYATRVGDIPFE